MEKVKYREIIEKILTDWVLYHQEAEIEIELIFDRKHDHYKILCLGWPKHTRVFASPIHIDIKNDKIWIQRDETEIGVANQLLEAGVPKHDIVLGFKSPDIRQLTEFAIS